MKSRIETGGEDAKSTLETRGEDVKSILETRWEDVSEKYTRNEWDDHAWCLLGSSKE